AYSHRFDCRRHCVRGVHSTAGPGAGTGITFDLEQFVRADSMGAVTSHRLKRADDGEILAFVTSGFNSAAVDKDRWDVQAGDGDHRAGHVLVASTDGEDSVHALSITDALDRVGYDLPGNQRVFHTFRAHGDGIAHCYRAKDLWHAP